MEEIRIRVTISPKMEFNIINSDEIREYYTFFKQIREFARTFSHILSVVLPNDIQRFLISDPLFKDLINGIKKDPRANIIFSHARSDCNIVFNSKSFSFKEQNVNALISIILKKNSLPLLLDVNEFFFNKVECNDKNNDCKNLLCRKNIVITSYNINQMSEWKENIIKCCRQNLDEWVLNQNSINSDAIKYIALLIAFTFDAEPEDFSQFSPVVILNEFCSDIKKLSAEDIKKVAFSFFRATVYPSVNSVERKEMSIDWHRNKPFNIGDFDLYRVDVVPLNKSGVKCSGTKRVLMAKRNGSSYIIAYTSEHDFNIEIVRHRLNTIL